MIIKDYKRLWFSGPLLIKETDITRSINPKRMQRVAHREVTTKGIGSKAQQALQLEYENNKKERRELSKVKKEKLERTRFEQKQLQKKEKRKGR